ncbi:MAG: Uma2 family endonuclease [Methylococcales bacterium]
MIHATATVRKHRVDIAEWRRLGEANIFPENIRVELIDGEIFEMPPIGSNHGSHVKRLNRLFASLIHDRAIIAVQDPVQLGRYSEPQPDFMLLRPAADFYSDQHPGPDDVLLLIEVADNSIQFDRRKKLTLYASHHIPEYWLLNLNENRLEVYREPRDKAYGRKMTLISGDRISLLQLPEIEIDIKDIL